MKSRFELPLRRTALAAAIATLFAAPLLHSASNPNVPLDAEFRVNTETSSDQALPVTAMDADGDFVIAWHEAQDGSLAGIHAQRYDAAGVAQGAAFRVNTYTTDSQTAPDIAMDIDGDFVAVWASVGQDGSSNGVYGQRFDATGAAQGAEFRVNTNVSGSQRAPAVAMDADGDFVVVWQSFAQDGSLDGVYGQRFDETGAPQGGEFHVNTFTSGYQFEADVAMDAAGNFVAVWASDNQDGSGFGVYARRYDAAGAVLGGEFLVNTAYLTNAQREPAIAMDAAGNFVIAWAGGNDGSGYGVYARRYNAAGTAQDSGVVISTATVANQRRPAIAMDADGDHVIVWESPDQDGSLNGVFAQRRSKTGLKLDAEFQVNTHTSGSQELPGIAMDADGDFVVAWQSIGQESGTGSGYGVYAQRFNGPEALDLSIAVSDNVDPVVAQAEYAYTLQVTNAHAPDALAGVGAASGVQLSFSPPIGSYPVAAGGPGWDCYLSGYSLNCDLLGSLAPGASSSVTVDLDAPRTAGTATARAWIEGIQYDPAGVNNSDRETTQVVARDANPNSFDFADVFDIATGVLTTSSTINIGGINAPAPISVSGHHSARYRINGGSWTSGTGTINSGDTVQLRLRSASTPNTTTGMSVQIGDRTDEWNVTTAGGGDTAPDAFNFPNKTDVAKDAQIASASRTPAGYSSPTAVTIAGDGSARYRINGGAWVKTRGTLVPGDTVELQLASSASPSTTVSCTVTIGGVSDTWSITTVPD